MHRYEQIRAEMLRRINQRIWTTETPLPHEKDLAIEFGVARGTVRKALEGLVEQGLIVRRKRSGTRVVARTGHASTLTIPIVRREIEDKGADYAYRLLAREIVAQGGDHVGLFGSVDLLSLRCLHLANGEPYQLEDRLINLQAVPLAREQDFKSLGPNEWMIEHVPYSSMRTVMSAEAADAVQVRYLRLARNAPVFIIERQTRDDEQTLTAVRMSHPAAHFRITMSTGPFS